MKRLIFALTVLLFTVWAADSVSAQGVPWRDHDPPYSFLFGNHIDTHQQTQELGNSQLQRFFYIRFAGPSIGGIREATHGQDRVGWQLRGAPSQARLIALSPVTWCVDPDDIPTEAGFSHFHWLGAPEHDDGLAVGGIYPGYLLKLTAVDTFLFMHHGEEGRSLVTPGIDSASHKNTVSNCW